MDWEQVVGTAMIILIVSLPIVIALLGPVIGGKKVEVRDLRPLLIDAAQNFLALQSLEKKDYQTFEDEVVAFLAKQVQELDIFSKDEKALLKPEIVRLLIGPYLKKVFIK